MILMLCVLRMPLMRRLPPDYVAYAGYAGYASQPEASGQHPAAGSQPPAARLPLCEQLATASSQRATAS